MTKLTTCFGLMALILTLAAGPVGSQEAAQGQGEAATSQNDKLQEAGRRLFKALADGDLAVVAQNTVPKYIRKMDAQRLRVPATGPKMKASFTGPVVIVRSSNNDAVIEAQIFTPDSSDVPASEVSRVRIYMVQQGGEWKASAADKKEDGEDSDINGGWYHSSFFTFCPNKGIIFVPNHFSRELKCGVVAQCARF